MQLKNMRDSSARIYGVCLSPSTCPTKSFIYNKDVLSAFEDFLLGRTTFLSNLQCVLQKESFSCFSSSNESALRIKIERLDKTVKLLKKNKKTGIDIFLGKEFAIPVKLSDKIPTADDIQRSKLNEVIDKTKNVVNENRELKRQMHECHSLNENLEKQVMHYEYKVEMLLKLMEIANVKYSNTLKSNLDIPKLQKECDAWEQKFDKLSKDLEKVSGELEEKKELLKRECTRNVNKKLKRRDEKIKVQESEIKILRSENEMKESELESMKKEKRRLLVKVCRLSKKNAHVEINCEEIMHLKKEIDEKQQRIRELEHVNAMLEDPIIQTYYDGKYTNEIRHTIMALVSECGVSQSKVNKVLEIVVKNLTGKSLDRLPSTGVKCRLVAEAKRIAQNQVAQEMLLGYETDPTKIIAGNCLHQDGTTKFHRHFQSFQITTPSQQTLSLGLAEVSSGDAETLLQEFKSQVSDLAESISNNDKDEKIAKLVTSITSTMSDQGSTNPVFNKQLSELKQTLMPEVIESWDELSDETRVQVSTISSYFCKMHIFVNMASEVDKCLSLFENNIACGRNPFAFNLSESGATRLTRTTCKGLSLGGCEKSGVGGHFSTFLQEKGKKNYLLTFRGHRFNHLFYAAGAVYHHASDVSSFLSNWVNPNDLLKSVHFDISEKSFLSGIRALGIIDKLITGPLWRHIESANNILDLNPILLTLKTKLEEFSKNAHPLLSGTPVFSEMIIHKDDIYESLFKDTGEPSFDAYTQMALELISGGMLLILERQAKDQLPGGKFFEPSFDETVRASNVPTTNTCSERDFAQLDVLMRCKPSAGTTAYESIIMWTNNKTSNWLSSLSEQEREDILDDARKNAPSMQMSIREKKENLFLEKVKLLKLRGEKKEAQEQKLYTQKVTLTRKLNEIGGLWMNDGDILAQKTHLPSQAFKEALITQLQFRKSVLHCKGPREKFQQSLKGRPFTVEELEDNLKSIILLNLEAEMEDEPHIVYHDISDAKDKVETSKLSLIKKINEGRNKITVQQQARLLPSFIQDPSKLVGKQIKHRCREENSPEVSWYHAIVQGLVKEKGKRSIYRVVYEENEDDAWEFPLLVDFGKGDLIILD